MSDCESKLSKKQDLLEYLFSFLESKEKLIPTLTGYFANAIQAIHDTLPQYVRTLLSFPQREEILIFLSSCIIYTR